LNSKSFADYDYDQAAESAAFQHPIEIICPSPRRVFELVNPEAFENSNNNNAAVSFSIPSAFLFPEDQSLTVPSPIEISIKKWTHSPKGFKIMSADVREAEKNNFNH
jgi:hypothetical protein